MKLVEQNLIETNLEQRKYAHMLLGIHVFRGAHMCVPNACAWCPQTRITCNSALEMCTFILFYFHTGMYSGVLSIIGEAQVLYSVS